MRTLAKQMIRGGVALGASLFLCSQAMASSHREAPFITENPKTDGTDFYLFRSYETGRDAFATVIANYIPLQDAYGGPNYFTPDPDAVYSIKLETTGDALEDVDFQFRFVLALQDIQLQIGTVNVSIPLIASGPLAANSLTSLNVIEAFEVDVVRYTNGRRRRATRSKLVNAQTGATLFLKPTDYVGTKTFPDYATFAGNFVYNVNVPGCNQTGAKMFVGQRREGFVVNLGEVFDLVNTNPLGPVDGERNTIGDKNITSFALELPISCYTSAANPVIAGWTTASLPKIRELTVNPTFNRPARSRGSLVQVSRLANPLVNEVVIGLKDKDRFNASQPKDDRQFLTYVTNPTVPALLQVLFGVTAPTVPRNDLVQVFLTGVDGLNKNGSTAEMMRLNTSIPVTPIAQQNVLGVLGGDLAGYPNGRRPVDDVVDITLRAAMGVLLPASQAPSGQLPYTDGALPNPADYLATFPYLATPIPGSPA